MESLSPGIAHPENTPSSLPISHREVTKIGARILAIIRDSSVRAPLAKPVVPGSDEAHLCHRCREDGAARIGAACRVDVGSNHHVALEGRARGIVVDGRLPRAHVVTSNPIHAVRA